MCNNPTRLTTHWCSLQSTITHVIVAGAPPGPCTPATASGRSFTKNQPPAARLVDGPAGPTTSAPLLHLTSPGQPALPSGIHDSPQGNGSEIGPGSLKRSEHQQQGRGEDGQRPVSAEGRGARATSQSTRQASGALVMGVSTRPPSSQGPNGLCVRKSSVEQSSTPTVL